jgi:hypothetical protein|tara:strand:+ start:719 stop:922 length:204 start_codon:yes stop_codon:yes gene_type:complete
MYINVIIAILSYTIVIVAGNLVKNHIERKRYGGISKEHRQKDNARWGYIYIVGVVLLYLVCSRGSPW